MVRTVVNPRYREGSVVTVWSLREELAAGRPVLLMDADVLYDARMIRRLCGSRHANCLLYDADIEDGEEPVKICLSPRRDRGAAPPRRLSRPRADVIGDDGRFGVMRIRIP